MSAAQPLEDDFFGGEFAVDFREPTPDELVWTNPRTPIKYEQRVRISCPDGKSDTALITFEDGRELGGVQRAVINIASSCINGEDGVATVYLTQWHEEIGKFVYSTAEVLVGGHVLTNNAHLEADVGPSALDVSSLAPDLDRRATPTRRKFGMVHDPERRIAMIGRRAPWKRERPATKRIGRPCRRTGDRRRMFDPVLAKDEKRTCHDRRAVDCERRVFGKADRRVDIQPHFPRNLRKGNPYDDRRKG